MEFRCLLKDIRIEIVDQIPRVDPVLYNDYHTKANSNEFHVHIPEVADIYATEGNSVLISPLTAQIDQESIELYLNGSITGALLHQRGILPLHGSSISFNNHAYLFCGESGYGKSTIAYSLSRDDNFSLLTDDITPLSNEVQVIPISEQLKLWGETLETLGVNKEQYTQVRKETDKYFVPITNSLRQKTPLGGIFVLSPVDEDTTIDEISGIEKFKSLSENVYWKELLEVIPEYKLGHFKLQTKICERIPFFRINLSRKNSILENKRIIGNFIRESA